MASDIGYGFKVAVGLRRLIGALAVALALLPSDGHAQVEPVDPRDPPALTVYTYAARTARKVTTSVTAGAVRWECREHQCSNIGPWPSLGIEACRSLARLVGPIEAFGRSGLQYTPAQVTECNRPSIELTLPGAVVFIGRSCASDDDCNDGMFCNGQEQCGSNRRCRRATPVNCDDRIACTTDRCDNETTACQHFAPDIDADGHPDQACILAEGLPAGDDCNDADSNVFPGNAEICNAVDEDCDPATIGEKDGDADGFVDMYCSNGALAGGDCDDSRSGANPNAPEVCNGVDDDCSGVVDDNDAPKVTTWPDNDRDGFGNSAGPSEDICLIGSVLLGRSLNNYDCNDADRARHPGSRCP